MQQFIQVIQIKYINNIRILQHPVQYPGLFQKSQPRTERNLLPIEPSQQGINIQKFGAFSFELSSDIKSPNNHANLDIDSVKQSLKENRREIHRLRTQQLAFCILIRVSNGFLQCSTNSEILARMSQTPTQKFWTTNNKQDWAKSTLSSMLSYPLNIQKQGDLNKTKQLAQASKDMSSSTFTEFKVYK
ncbi:hypothetical protein PPERSA_11508 [Pseudocohnilembus persalinus]|uniref:Uncharacterized protein n=1 Tax=Pseudocohnilembus persalinus TaxID=266149 RepID=A0A0V0QX21_PSEPJ|nr:hypothetical protein PPERSA_11508 [Pseudocohnilembus persalinus]|eukprot:KRX06863.1 hypothetical protein PPERSA_11508 [Pseudocohnilembus persalinus]